MHVTEITLQNTSDGNGETYTLTTSNSTSTDDTTLIIKLSIADNDSILANPLLLHNADSSYISLTAATIDDLSQNPIVAILSSDAMGVNNYLGDTLEPADFTVGSITAVDGNVRSGYWNNTNLSLNVTVPIANDYSLMSGEIQLIASIDGGGWQDLGSAATIPSVNTNQVVNIAEGTIETLGSFGDNTNIEISAILTDNASNADTGNASATIILVDITDPDVALDTIGTEPFKANDTVRIIAEYSEDMFSAPSISVDQPGSSDITDALMTTVAQDSFYYDYIVVPNTLPDSTYYDGNITLSITTQTDVAGNYATGATGVADFDIDTESPTDTLSLDNTNSLIQAGPLTITLNYSEDIIGTPNITIGQQGSDSIINVPMTPNGQSEFSYTYNVQQDNGSNYIDGLANITISTQADAAGNNAGSPLGTTSFNIDTEQPTVNLTTNHPDTIVRDADVVTITATFDDDGNSIDEDSIPTITIVGTDVTDSLMTKITNKKWKYVWDVPSGDDGLHNIEITAYDEAGNKNTDPTGDTTFLIDNGRPSVILSNGPEDQVVRDADAFTITATFTDDYGINEASPPTISFDGVFVKADTLMTKSLNLVWTYNWNVPGGVNGVTNISISATDTAGNTNTPVTVDYSYLIDNINPTVSLTNDHSGTYVKEADIINFTATFTESNTIDISDAPHIIFDYVSLPDPNLDTVMTFSSNKVWTCAWEVPSGNDGPVSISITAADSAGNPSDPASGITAFTIDNTQPTVALTTNHPDTIVKDADIITITASFTDDYIIEEDPNPTITIGTLIVDSNMTKINNKKWIYIWDVPSGNDSLVVISVSATDKAANIATIDDSLKIFIDNTAATLDSVNIVSNNADSSLAIDGNVITLLFRADEYLDTSPMPTVTIAGNSVTPVGGPTLFTATYTMDDVTDDDAYPLPFTIGYTDISGNSAQTTTTTDGTNIRYDETAPTLFPVSIASDNTDPTLAMEGDAISVSFTVSEVLIADPVVLIEGNTATVSNTLLDYTATYLLDGSEHDTTQVEFSINFTDSAGNAGLAVIDVTDGSIVAIDNSVPGNQNGVYTTSQSVNPGEIVNIGSSDYYSDEVWFAPAGQTLSTDFTLGTDMTKAAHGLATTINAPMDEGFYFIYVIDKSGNVSDASTAYLRVDNSVPVVETATVITADYLVNDLLTLTIETDSSGEEYGVNAISINSITYPDPRLDFDTINDSTYTITYTVTDGDNTVKNGNMPISIVLEDNGGNTNVAFTTLTGSPKIFGSRPTSAIGTDATICADDSTEITITLTGIAPWDITYTDGTTPTNVTTSLNPYIDTVTIAGTYQVTSLTDSAGNNGLSLGGTATVVVNALPTVTFDIVNSYNVESDAIDLSAAVSPIGGTFAGSGVIPQENMFYPSIADTLASFDITYTYTDGNGCTSVKAENVTVNTSSAYIENLFADYCYYDLADTIIGHNENNSIGWFTIENPDGGNDGLSDSSANKMLFNPAIAGPGQHTITYYYPEGATTVEYEQFVYVDSLNTVNINPELQYCILEGNRSINAYNTPTEGTGTFFSNFGSAFIQPGNTTANLNTNDTSSLVPGVYFVSYYYTSEYNCISDTVTKSVTINPLPDIYFPLKSNYNVDGADINLVPNIPGGTFTGDDASVDQFNNTFSPSEAGTGNYNISYSYTDPATQCSNTYNASTDVKDALDTIANLKDKYCYVVDSFIIKCTPLDFDSIVGVGFTCTKNANAITVLTDFTALYKIHVAGKTEENNDDVVTYTYYIDSTIYWISHNVQIDSIGAVDFDISDGISYCEDEEDFNVLAILDKDDITEGDASFNTPLGILNYGEAAVLDPAKSSTYFTGTDSTFTLNFTYTTEICTSSISKDVTIYKLPEVDFGLNASYNVESQSEILIGSRNGDYGVENFYSSKGVTPDGELQPKVIGVKNNVEITYTFTDSVSMCANSITKQTNIIDALAFIVRNNDEDSLYCIGETDIFTGHVITAFDTSSAMFIYENDTTFDTTFVFNASNYPVNQKLTFRFEYLGLDSTKLGVSQIITVDKKGDIISTLEDSYCETDGASTIEATVDYSKSTTARFSANLSRSFAPETRLTNGFNFDTETETASFAPEDLNDTIYGTDSVYIMYIFESDLSSCEDTLIESTWINTLPELTLNLKTLYNRENTDNLFELIGTPTGGEFKAQQAKWIEDTIYFNPNEVDADDIGNDLFITYKYTDDVTGCYNEINDTFKVDKPRGLINDDDNYLYCNYEPEIKVYYDELAISEDIRNKLSSTVGQFTFSGGTIDDRNNDTAYIYPINLSPGDYTITYTYWGEDSAEFDIEQIITIHKFGVVSFAGVADHYCDGVLDDVYLSTAVPSTPDDFTIQPSGDDISIVPQGGEAYFRVRSAELGRNIITYTYSEFGCDTTISDTTIIHEKPDINFSLSDECIIEPIQFTDLSTLDSTNQFDEKIAWEWFINDNSIPFSRAQDTLYKPDQQYVEEDETKIKLRVYSTNEVADCYAEKSLPFNFGAEPFVDFLWVNECEGIDTVQFYDNTTGGVITNSILKWNFGDGDSVDNALENISHKYSNAGSYDVTYTITNDNGCSGSETKLIHIRPVIKIADYDNKYLFDFEEGKQNWFAEADPSKDYTDYSWEWGSPEKSTLNGGYFSSNAWVTGLDSVYLSSEWSYVTSPCFDIRGLKKPMVKLHKWVDSEDVDGTVLQYSSNETDWFNLGEQLNGINWFNSNEIFSNPGGINGVNQGWTKLDNSDPTWEDARIPLTFATATSPIDSSKLRFRFAFASDNSTGDEGFAFDDFWIGERDRNVLIEHFIDASGNVDDISNFDAAGKDFEKDVIDIQYHYSNTQEDPLYLDNTTDPLVRSFYYDIAGVPYYTFDGKYPGTPVNEDTLITRTLSQPDFDITGTASIASGTDIINVTANITALSKFSKQKITAYVAIIEEEITGINAGDNENITCRNVVKKLLPNASGMVYNKAWNIGDSEEFTTSWKLDIRGTTDNIKVVIFVQNVNSREVYQAHLIENGGITTGIDNIISRNEFDFMLYPNPATDEVYVVLSNNLPANSFVQMFNTTGLMIHNKPIELDKKIIKLDLDYLSGLHYVRIISENKILSSKKLIVIKK
ncbi:PKD domain-containing protein [Bacteroidota bacterium]